MARRRHTRRRRHHRGFGVLYKLLSAIVISAAIVVALTLFFKVDAVSVSGVTQYSGDEVIAASGVEVGDNLFLLNKYEIADAIRAQLPYVSSVSISRKFPDTLIIEVMDGVLGGVIEQGGTYWVISSAGKIVDSRAETGGGMQIWGIVLEAPEVGKNAVAAEGNERRLDQLFALLEALETKGMLQGCHGMDFSETGLISMEYADRFTVKLAYDMDFVKMLTKVNAVAEQLEREGDLRPGVIDTTIEDTKIHFIPT